MKRIKIRRFCLRLVGHWGLWVIVAAVCFPLLWTVSTAFKPDNELFTVPPRLFPRYPTLENFRLLFLMTNFLTYYKNSLIVSISTTLITIVIGTLAAYSSTRFQSLLQRAFMRSILLYYMFAPVILFIPLVVLFTRLQLDNTLYALILAHLTITLPFSIWLLRAIFSAIPIELEEAVMVDGGNRIQSIIHVVLPNAMPGIISTAIFAFILSWNDFVYSSTIITQDRYRALAPGIAIFIEASGVEWGFMMAAATLTIIPVLVFFVFLQKHVVREFGAGALKQ
ncbi:MAG: carbohydrate ABC transporter permease [Candidatus Aerophobus sp.]|nr:MAG: carbohydrate ABC transporter permease [Candidatus Aerophobus sp.]